MTLADIKDTDILFTGFDLPEEVLKGIDTAGFKRCTPIQAQALPLTLKGRDIAAQAQTGTGKTATFLITILNRLLREPAPKDPNEKAI